MAVTGRKQLGVSLEGLCGQLTPWVVHVHFSGHYARLEDILLQIRKAREIHLSTSVYIRSSSAPPPPPAHTISATLDILYLHFSMLKK